jgi:hypothetical protein
LKIIIFIVEPYVLQRHKGIYLQKRGVLVLKLRGRMLVLCILVLGMATSHADSLIGYFNLACPSGDCSANTAGGNPVGPITTVPTVGQIIFTLNSDGTIAASLDDYGPATVSGFGFNSSGNTAESAFTPGTPDYEFGWGDLFGYQYGGFGSYVTYDVPLQESWVIGNPGDFTSVFQALDGGSNSQVDFFLYDSNGYWGADAQPFNASPVPEPGNFMLLGTGTLALIGTIRRKLAR